VANSRSARKRIRANERKHVRNRTVRSAVRTRITKARRALLGTEVQVQETPELVLAAVRELDRAAEKGILHRNNANRRKSRLMAMAHRLLTAAEGAAGEDQAAVRAAAAGGVKGRGRAGTTKSAAKSSAKASTRPAADKPKTTSTRAATDKPKTTSTRAKKS
jgi:small subunit ribosomal protein S20